MFTVTVMQGLRKCAAPGIINTGNTTSQLDTMSLLDDARITHKLDQRIIEAVNNLDLSKQRADSLLSEISNIGINENALHSLIDDTWLRQDVIDAICLLFEAEFPDAAFFGPAFTRKLLGKKVGGHVNSTDPNSVQCNWNDVSSQMKELGQRKELC